MCAVLEFPATAAAAPPTISGFSASSGNSAGWVNGVDAPGDTDGQAVRLRVATYGTAALNLGDVGSTPPSSPPSFVFRPAQDFPENFGSAQVQVTIDFSNYEHVSAGSYTSWTAAEWTPVGGPNATWQAYLGEAAHGGCNVAGTYQQAIACASANGATVVGAGVEAVLFTPPTTGSGPDVYVDDLSYGGTTFTTGGAATTVTVTNPWPTVSPPPTAIPTVSPPPTAIASLVGTARVSRRTGRGVVAARCPQGALPCHFFLKLTTGDGGVRVGTVTGTLNAPTGRLAVHLNAKGRPLLRAKRTVRLFLSGALPGGTPVKNGSSLTVKAITGPA
jgi:hypothetical protein